MKLLLDSGADPTQQGRVDIAQTWIERLRSIKEGETSCLISAKDIPIKISVLKAAISTMEEYIFGEEGASWERFARGNGDNNSAVFSSEVRESSEQSDEEMSE